MMKCWLKCGKAYFVLKNVFFIVLDCGKIINLSNGGSEEIKMTSYTQGKTCTWLVKVNITEVRAWFFFFDLSFKCKQHFLQNANYAETYRCFKLGNLSENLSPEWLLRLWISRINSLFEIIFSKSLGGVWFHYQSNCDVSRPAIQHTEWLLSLGRIQRLSDRGRWKTVRLLDFIFQTFLYCRNETFKSLNLKCGFSQIDYQVMF